MYPNKPSFQPPTGLLVGALVLTAVVLAYLVWDVCDSNRLVEELKHQYIRCVQLQGVIIHLDEVLTMSARMAAATGDLNWEKRYRHNQLELDAAIKEATQLAPQPALVQMAAQTGVANLKLVDMEHRAFDLVHHGQLEQARAVLSSPAYEEQKQVYAAGINHLLDKLTEQWNVKLHLEADKSRWSILGTIVVLAMLLFAWFNAMRTLTEWRAALRRAYDSLETRVEERTAELTAEITEHKQTEAVLQRSTDEIRDLYNNAPCGYHSLDKDGVIVRINDTELKWLGYSRDEVIGKMGASDIYTAEGLELFHEKFPQFMQQGWVRDLEFEFVRKDGTTLPVLLSATAVKDASGKYVMSRSTSFDITERKRTMNALRLQSEVANNMEEGVVLIRACDGLIVYANPKFEKMFGYQPGELNGKPVSGLNALTEKSPEEAAREIMAALREKGVWSGEVCNQGRTGAPFWCFANVSTFEHPDHGTIWISVHSDITERKRGEEALRRSYQTQEVLNSLLSISLQDISLEETLQQVINHILAIPWLSLEAKGGIFLVEADPFALVLKAQRNLSANLQAACGLVPFGRCLCGRAAASGKMEFAAHVDDRHEISYEGMAPHGHYCLPIVSAGKTLGVINLYVKENHRPESNENEFLGAVANVVAGIIQRKRAEEQLKQALADRTTAHEELKATQLQLIEAAKMESVGQLAAGVAHEVKNPLSIALLGVEYLSSTIATNDDQAATALKDTKEAILQADKTIRELLSFSAPAKLDMKLQDLNERVEHSLYLVRHEMRKRHVTSKLELGQSLPHLQLDKNKIEQALVNLCMNAIEAMPESGTLIFKTRANQLETGVTEVILEVEDSGPGIPEEDLEKVFDPFFTRKQVGKGTGLGLTIIRQIIDMHDGSIRMSNRPEGGAKATIILKT